MLYFRNQSQLLATMGELIMRKLCSPYLSIKINKRLFSFYSEIQSLLSLVFFIFYNINSLLALYLNNLLTIPVFGPTAPASSRAPRPPPRRAGRADAERALLIHKPRFRHRVSSTHLQRNFMIQYKDHHWLHCLLLTELRCRACTRHINSEYQNITSS